MALEEVEGLVEVDQGLDSFGPGKDKSTYNLLCNVLLFLKYSSTTSWSAVDNMREPASIVTQSW